MKFNSDEIASVIQAEIEKYESAIDVREVGTVLEVGDGIARVYGLSNIMAGDFKIGFLAINTASYGVTIDIE